MSDGFCQDAVEGLPANAGLEEINDAEYFRQLNNTRKAKAKRFLADKKTRFNLLMTLTLVNVLSPTTAILFETSNATTEKEYKPSKKVQENKRRRVRFKSADHAAAAELETEDRAATFSDVPLAARAALSRLWRCLLSSEETDDIFLPSKIFWPAGEGTSGMFKELTDEALRVMGSLKWRLIARLSLQPLSAVELDKHMEPSGLPMGPDAPEELLALVRKHCEQLRATPSCCLDSGWARPVKEKISASEDAYACYADTVADLVTSFISRILLYPSVIVCG